MLTNRSSYISSCAFVINVIINLLEVLKLFCDINAEISTCPNKISEDILNLSELLMLLSRQTFYYEKTRKMPTFCERQVFTGRA